MLQLTGLLFTTSGSVIALESIWHKRIQGSIFYLEERKKKVIDVIEVIVVIIIIVLLALYLSKNLIFVEQKKTKWKDKLISSFRVYKLTITYQLSDKLIPMFRKLDARLVNIGVSFIIIGAILQFIAIII